MGVIAGFEIAAGGVVRFHAAGRNPFKVAMRGDWGVGLIEVAINVRVAWEGVRLRAVGEVVDVFRADDMDEFECWVCCWAGTAPDFEQALVFGRAE